VKEFAQLNTFLTLAVHLNSLSSFLLHQLISKSTCGLSSLIRLHGAASWKKGSEKD